MAAPAVASPVAQMPAAPMLAPANAALSGATVAPSAAPSPANPNNANAAQAEKPQASAKDSNTTEGSESLPAGEAQRKTAAAVSEFQRFVQRNTGQLLPLFGYNLFDQPARYAPVLAAPVPSTYVLGPGDELMVQTFGIVDLAQRLVIDRDGNVSLPKVGPLRLAGVPFGEAQKVLDRHLSKVYKNYTLSLTMGQLRSIEVFVLGQAAQPGKHVVSGLSTLINALFETGGASANGTLRQVELRRGGQTIATVDLYRFLAMGDSSGDVRLQSGDVIFIAPAGARAAVLGTVNAPAVYELKSGETIADVLSISGGLPVLAAPQKAQLERVNPNQAVARYVEDFALDAQGLQRELVAGDVLTVFQISPQIANVVTLEGNVAAPMRYTYKPGMRVKDILSEARLLIPSSYWDRVNQGANSDAPVRQEVNLDYATIQRLDPNNLQTRLLAFSPIKAIAGHELENLELKTGDIVTVYAPNDPGPATEDSVTVRGEVVGGLKRFPYRLGMTVRDLIPSTQWLVDYYQYWQRNSGKDIRSDINWDYAQILRRVPNELKTRALEFNLGEQIMATSVLAMPMVLEAGDELTLFTTAQLQVPLAKRTQFVRLMGEVAVPGIYQLRAGETLSQLMARAGGVTPNAYVYGTQFVREATKQQQQRNLDEAVRRFEAQLRTSSSKLAQNQTGTDEQTLQAALITQEMQLASMRNLKASGRIALELDPKNPQFPEVLLEDGDTITVPNKPSFVGVYGAVAVESSLIFRNNTSVQSYLDKAGITRTADLDSVLLVRADGTVRSNQSERGWLQFGSFMSTNLMPGDSIFVPEQTDFRTPYTLFMLGLKDWTQVLYQFGLGAAAWKTLD